MLAALSVRQNTDIIAKYGRKGFKIGLVMYKRSVLPFRKTDTAASSSPAARSQSTPMTRRPTTGRSFGSGSPSWASATACSSSTESSAAASSRRTSARTGSWTSRSTSSHPSSSKSWPGCLGGGSSPLGRVQ